MTAEIEELRERLSALEQRLTGMPSEAPARGLHLLERLEESGKLSYNFKNAAAVLDLSYSTLWREMSQGNLHPMEGIKLISREELIRWVRERSPKVVPRTRSKYAPV